MQSKNLSTTTRDLDRVKLINKQLSSIKKMYKKNFKLFKKHKRIDTVLKVTINLCNAITVSSVIVSATGALPVLIVTIATSTIGGGLSVIRDTVDYQSKAHTYQTTYLQELDIYNTYTNLMLSKDRNLDNILNELNAKMGIILDRALPVSTSSLD